MTPKRMAHIKHSQMPVLVMTGTQDDVIRQPVSSKYLARHLGARLEVFPGAGHAIRLQHPDRHNVLLKTHILGAVRKEQERLDDRLRSALAVLKGVCAGPAYTARAAAIRDEMEREWRRNGGRHHLVVEYGGVNRARRISIRQSLSSLRRKSRGSLRSVALSDSSSRTALHGNLPEKARLNISLSNFATSVQDLFAPAEIEPGTGDGHQMESVVHPSSSTFLSWVFPAFPPLLTIEREIVVDQLEFEGLVFDQQESIRTEGSSGLTDEDGVEISRGESATTGLSFRSLTNFISQFVQGRV
ncbi:hypothetical protein HDU82_006523 [Entophlyctis luteolus]|nr:hypothetical protein HDU82_006523 [Entophlyctis luteolus]